MSLQWYVLRSKPNSEMALWREALARGVDVFYPQLRVQPKNPRARKIRPYFPGYLFIRVDLQQSGYSAYAWMPHSRELVSFGAEPAAVPDELISIIRRRLDEINRAGGEQLADLHQGDAVNVQSGPFAGYDAIFDTKLSADGRVRVFINLLRRQTTVDLPIGQICKRKP